MATGKKTGGRVKGTPNKLNASVKEAIVNAFKQVGGEDYLVTVAKEDPRTFCTLLGKVIPIQAEITGEDGGPIKITGINIGFVEPEPVKEETEPEFIDDE